MLFQRKHTVTGRVSTVLMECLAKKWVNKEKVEESIQKTGAKFVFGADSFDDIKDISKGFRKVKDDDIRRGMTTIYPILKLFMWIAYRDAYRDKDLEALATIRPELRR